MAYSLSCSVSLFFCHIIDLGDPPLSIYKHVLHSLLTAKLHAIESMYLMYLNSTHLLGISFLISSYRTQFCSRPPCTRVVPDSCDDLSGAVRSCASPCAKWE